MYEWLGIVATLGGALGGVVLGWFLRRSDQQRLFRVNELRYEFERVYGPLYGLVDRLEKSVIYEEGKKQPRVPINAGEKAELDKVMTTYTWVISKKIRRHWLSWIRDMKKQADPSVHYEYYPLTLEFRDLIKEEYNRRLTEYRKLTGTE